MDIADATEFISNNKSGVLVTTKRDGRPQTSNIVFVVDDGQVLISVTDSRAKTRNLRRDPRATLHVSSDDFWSYVSIEADVELMPVATDPHDATVDALVEYYRQLAGEHDDWDDYRRVMVDDGRLLLRLTPTHASGAINR